MLTLFRKTLAPGSTRLKVYDTEFRKARKNGRLPEEAKAVFDEIVEKLHRTIRETALQRKERVEKEFAQLVMGKLSHSTFRAEAQVEIPGRDSLYRTYLRKLAPELRTAVIRQSWDIVEGEAPRRPRRPGG